MSTDHADILGETLARTKQHSQLCGALFAQFMLLLCEGQLEEELRTAEANRRWEGVVLFFLIRNGFGLGPTRNFMGSSLIYCTSEPGLMRPRTGPQFG